MEVVKLITGGPYVALTLLGKPPSASPSATLSRLAEASTPPSAKLSSPSFSTPILVHQNTPVTTAGASIVHSPSSNLRDLISGPVPVDVSDR